MQLYTVLLLAVGAQISVAATLPLKAVEPSVPTLAGRASSSQSGDSLAIEEPVPAAGSWRGCRAPYLEELGCEVFWMAVSGVSSFLNTSCMTLDRPWDKKINTISVPPSYAIIVYPIPDCKGPGRRIETNNDNEILSGKLNNDITSVRLGYSEKGYAPTSPVPLFHHNWELHW